MEDHCIPSSDYSCQVEPTSAGSECGDGDTCSTGDDSSDSSLLDSQIIEVAAAASPPSSPSMSRRRMASNHPTLNCNLLLPPVPDFNNTRHSAGKLSSGSTSGSTPGSTPCGLDTPSLIFSSRQSSLFSLSAAGNDEPPVTPIDQIIHDKHTPPDAPRAAKTKARRKSLLNSMLSLSLTDNPCEDSFGPSYPFTPLEDIPRTYAVDAAERGSVSPDVPLRVVCTTSGAISSKPSESSVSEPTPLPATSRIRRKLLSNVPRRLSYRHGAVSTPSPLTLDPGSLDLGLSSRSLASPMILQAPGPASTQRATPPAYSPRPTANVEPSSYFQFRQ